MKIDDTVKAIIKREGDFVDHPSDKGGPTRFGVTEHEARANGYEGDMRDLPESFADALYRSKYWTDPKFDQIASLSPSVADELIDTGVNMGPTTASKFLQRALNVLNLGVTTYPNMIVDGNVGKMTLYGMKQFLGKRGADGETVLLRMLNSQQGVRYIELAEANVSQEDFEFGWFLQRIGALS
jgi:lysozyme family protein